MVMTLMKPSEREEEYFAREMFEKKQKAEQEKQKKLAEAERQKAKELHRMKCPKCGMNLVEIDYKSIKVDRCSSEGVWLDAVNGPDRQARRARWTSCSACSRSSVRIPLTRCGGLGTIIA
jgi:hypothetical protein